MPGADSVEIVLGFLLVFFLPGYGVTKAVFPEWRVRGVGALRRLVEILTLSFVLSIVLTVLVGYVELTVAPGGFRAYWTDPVLEVSLLAVTGVAFALALARGAFRREPPTRVAPPAPGGDEGAFELTRELDRLGREGRRIRHALRVAASTPSEKDRLETRLREVENERTELERRREAEYAD